MDDKSKSAAGTRRVQTFVNSDSPKALDRSEAPMAKCGSRNDGTEAGHILGIGLANVVLTNTRGRPHSDETKQAIVAHLNSDSNLRIVSTERNRVVDERRDARVAEAYVNNTPIQGKSTTDHAYRAYKAAEQLKESTDVSILADRLGEMRVMNPDTGRSHKLKNHDKYT